ncbi:MAG: GIY-YIG nuclease family protein, partial [Sulfitobacter sp.]|nr:GIY-YIG nuclease family protein [Sulfitobacter sp.]
MPAGRKHKVYKLTFPNGKVYVGYTGQSIKRRMSAHKSAAEIAASNAKKARSANDNGFYGKRHSKESLARGVARR